MVNETGCVIPAEKLVHFLCAFDDVSRTIIFQFPRT